jgi:hypothetical protein
MTGKPAFSITGSTDVLGFGGMTLSSDPPSKKVKSTPKKLVKTSSQF